MGIFCTDRIIVSVKLYLWISRCSYSHNEAEWISNLLCQDIVVALNISMLLNFLFSVISLFHIMYIKFFWSCTAHIFVSSGGPTIVYLCLPWPCNGYNNEKPLKQRTYTKYSYFAHWKCIVAATIISQYKDCTP